MEQESALRDEAASLVAKFCIGQMDANSTLKYATLCRSHPRELLLQEMALMLVNFGALEKAFELTADNPAIRLAVQSYIDQTVLGFRHNFIGQINASQRRDLLRIAHGNREHHSRRVHEMTRNLFDYGSRDDVRTEHNPLHDRCNTDHLLLKLVEHALNQDRPDSAEVTADQLNPGPLKDAAYKNIVLHYFNKKNVNEAFRVKDKIRDRRVHES